MKFYTRGHLPFFYNRQDFGSLGDKEGLLGMLFAIYIEFGR
jgi:hypothetical protein